MYDLYYHGRLVKETEDAQRLMNSIAYLFDGAHWEENLRAIFPEWDFVGDTDHQVLFYLIEE